MTGTARRLLSRGAGFIGRVRWAVFAGDRFELFVKFEFFDEFDLLFAVGGAIGMEYIVLPELGGRRILS